MKVFVNEVMISQEVKGQQVVYMMTNGHPTKSRENKQLYKNIQFSTTNTFRVGGASSVWMHAVLQD